MERSVSVSSDQNIRDHLWRWTRIFRPKFALNFDKPVHCPTSLLLRREFGKELKIVKSYSSWFARLNRMGISHGFLTGHSGIRA